MAIKAERCENGWFVEKKETFIFANMCEAKYFIESEGYQITEQVAKDGEIIKIKGSK